MNTDKKEEPIVSKSLIGNLWRIEYGNIIKITNQEGMEKYLKEIQDAKGQD